MLVRVYSIIMPLLGLAPGLALHTVSFVNGVHTLTRASAVSEYWRKLFSDECLWKNMRKTAAITLQAAYSGGVCCYPVQSVVRRLSVAQSEAKEEAREAALGPVASLPLSESETMLTEDLDIDFTNERAVLKAEQWNKLLTPPYHSRAKTFC